MSATRKYEEYKAAARKQASQAAFPTWVVIGVMMVAIVVAALAAALLGGG